MQVGWQQMAAALGAVCRPRFWLQVFCGEMKRYCVRFVYTEVLYEQCIGYIALLPDDIYT